MAPRYRTRTLLPGLVLALLLLLSPARALAGGPGFASTCGGTGDALTAAADTTSVSSSWQNADITVNLTGTGVAGWEWMVDCGTVQSGAPGSTVTFNVSGQHVLSHRARDAGGLWTDWVDSVVKLDKSVPVNTTPVSPTWSTAGFSVNVTGADTVSSVPLVHWNLDGAGWSSGASGSLVSVSTEGPHTLVTWVEDAAGNQSSQRTDTFGVDSTPPANQTVVPSGWQYTDTYITVHGTDAGSGVSQVQWKIDGNLATGADGASVHMPEGTHSFQSQIIDVAGNASGWSTPATVQVDTTGPLDTTTVPSTWQKTVPVNVNVTGTDTGGAGIDHVDWKLDGVPGTAVGISHVVPVTGDGDHVLQTRIVDSGGYDSGWKTQHVLIDTILPSDNTTMASGWQTQPVDVNVTGTDADSGVDHVDWQLDNGGQQTAVGSSQSVHVAGDGVHTLVSRIVDVAGNVTGWKTTTIRIDASAPHNTTPTVPNTAWRATPYTVQLTGDDDVSGLLQMHYRIDNGSDTTGPSGILRATVSGAGTHTLTTWAEDVAGNTTGLRNETINIDPVAPVDTTTAPATPVQNNYPVTVNGTDALSGVSGVKWRVDGGAIQTGSNGSVVTISGNGAHSLQTDIVDNAGNESGWKTTTVTVDLSLTPDSTPPTDTSTSSPSTWSPSDVTNLTVSATDAGTGVAWVQYRIDGVISSQLTFHNGDTPVPVTIHGDGPHLLETRAADAAGNISVWRLQTVNIDTVQPADTSVLPASGAWTNTRSFALSGDDPLPGAGLAKIQYSVDGGSIQTVVTAVPITVTVPTDGTHTIWHRVIDGAEQASAGVTSTFKVDTVVPVNTSAAAPTAWQTASGVSLPLTGSDALSGVARTEWRVNGGATTASATATVSADGVQTLETRAVDNAGNASAWRPETVSIDRTAPVNTTPTPAGAWQNTTYTTSVAGTDATSGVAGIEWKLDGGSTVTTPSVTISASGAHTLLSRIKDVAGNYSAWRTDTINIDKVAPSLTVDCGTTEWRATPATCSVAADGGASGLSAVTASVGSGTTDTVTGSSYTIAGDGAHSMTFRAVDGAGNEKLALAQVKIDGTAPGATLSCSPGPGTTYVCAATGSDALSGLSGLSWSVDGGAATPIASGATFTVSKGTVRVSATDVAGNVGSAPPLVLKARTAPSTTTPTKTPTVTPRTASRAVLRKGKGSVAARALGQLEISALPEATTATMRPLALGKGTFKIAIKVTADRKTKGSAKVYKTRSGYSPQIVVKGGGAADVKVTLTVQRRVGSRWVTYASGTVKL